MSTIAPPPLDPRSPSVQHDNAVALATLKRGAPRSVASSLLALAGFGAVTLAAGAVSAIVHRSARNRLWYRTLRKPRFTAPSALYPVVWSALYAGAAISAWRVWRTPSSRARTEALALWGGQLVLNTAWSPLFFGAHRPRLALADLGGNLGALGAYAAAAARVDGVAAALVGPYLGWLGYGAATNAGIIRKNAWRLRG